MNLQVPVYSPRGSLQKGQPRTLLPKPLASQSGPLDRRLQFRAWDLGFRLWGLVEDLRFGV